MPPDRTRPGPPQPQRQLVRNLPGALARAPQRLRLLRRGELGLLLQAPLLLPVAAMALRRWGLRRVQGAVARRPLRSDKADDDPAARQAAAERLGWCVQVAAAYGPWRANCLQRSLVLWWLLRRRGLEGDLRIGVRRDPASGVLEFHAWIEYGGFVLNDRRDVRQRYATFDRAIVPDSATFV